MDATTSPQRVVHYQSSGEPLNSKDAVGFPVQTVRQTIPAQEHEISKSRVCSYDVDTKGRTPIQEWRNANVLEDLRSVRPLMAGPPYSELNTCNQETCRRALRMHGPTPRPCCSSPHCNLLPCKPFEITKKNFCSIWYCNRVTIRYFAQHCVVRNHYTWCLCALAPLTNRGTIT